MFSHLTPDSALNLTVRPSQNRIPEIPLPFFPRSFGHFRLGAGVTEEVPCGEKQFVEFFWVIAGRGEVYLNNRWCSAGAGDCFYHLPGDAHIHRVAGEFWEYRWMGFDGPGAADFMQAYDYPGGVFHSGPCPAELFSEVGHRLRERSPLAWREMVAVIARILALAGEEASEAGSLAARAARICQEQFHNPALNVNLLAELLGVERSTLLRRFREEMRITPSRYLTRQRLQYALGLLRQNRGKLAEVARKSGFSDANYLCRVVRRATGMNPGRFRLG